MTLACFWWILRWPTDAPTEFLLSLLSFHWIFSHVYQCIMLMSHGLRTYESINTELSGGTVPLMHLCVVLDQMWSFCLEVKVSVCVLVWFNSLIIWHACLIVTRWTWLHTIRALGWKMSVCVSFCKRSGHCEIPLTKTAHLHTHKHTHTHTHSQCDRRRPEELKMVARLPCQGKQVLSHEGYWLFFRHCFCLMFLSRFSMVLCRRIHVICNILLISLKCFMDLQAMHKWSRSSSWSFVSGCRF